MRCGRPLLARCSTGANIRWQSGRRLSWLHERGARDADRHDEKHRVDHTGGDEAGGPASSQLKASSHEPRVEALEYSVARFSKKLVCSIALSIWSIHGSGFLASLR